MHNQRKFYLVGNWKMNMSLKDALSLVNELKTNQAFSKAFSTDRFELVVAPAFTMLHPLIKELKNTIVKVSAQDCYYQPKGAFTGEVSAAMLKDIGVEFCIFGHSERRQLFLESDELVAKKVKSALAHDIIPILCIGETKQQRDKDQHFEVVKRQLSIVYKNLDAKQQSNIIIAYEPVWAIGTGQTASPSQVGQMHQHIRQVLGTFNGNKLRDEAIILYGGSVKPSNAKELSLVNDVDGFLIGSASLNFDDLNGIFVNSVT